MTENGKTNGSGESVKSGVTLKAADNQGKVYTCVSGKNTQGKFGPQVAMQVEGNKHVIYVGLDSSIGKGLASGKLRFPIRVTGTIGYGSEGPFPMWGLAPRDGAPAAGDAPTPA